MRATRGRRARRRKRISRVEKDRRVTTRCRTDSVGPDRFFRRALRFLSCPLLSLLSPSLPRSLSPLSLSPTRARATRRGGAAAKMVASAVYILDVKGKVLISRNYRGDVPANAVDKFMPLAIENEDDESVGPVLLGDGVSYVYVQHNNLYRTKFFARARAKAGWAAWGAGAERSESARTECAHTHALCGPGSRAESAKLFPRAQTLARAVSQCSRSRGKTRTLRRSSFTCTS